MALRFSRSCATSRGSSVRVQAAFQPTGVKLDALKAVKKQVVELNGTKVLLVAEGDEVFAVSNKCSHLGLPLVGKTAFFQGEISDGCVKCAAHDTRFDLRSGEVVGAWCPKFPDLPLVGKMTAPKPLPTYKSRMTESGDIEVEL